MFPGKKKKCYKQQLRDKTQRLLQYPFKELVILSFFLSVGIRMPGSYVKKQNLTHNNGAMQGKAKLNLFI